MNARNTLFAMFALIGLATSAFAQDWTSEATYTKTVTTTAVTTYAPAIQNSYTQPWNNAPASQPTVIQTNYAPPAYSEPISLQPSNVQPAYPQPTYVSYGQPAGVPMAYSQPAYVQPVVYAQPAIAARPVVVNYTPAYRPVVVGYTPTYVAGPTTCEVPVAQPVVAAAPAGPKVWVHEKVYVQGQPLRNLVTAITP
jgi:hypothetical protein